MGKVDIRELFNSKQKQMLSTFALTGELSHPVSKGDATESEWRQWFNDYFPKRYRAEKAFVIDCNGDCSEQMDVVIYDTHFSPTIFQVNSEKYIPAESVYAVFEVKQNLNKEHIIYAQEKIESVKKLVRTSADINTITGVMKGRVAPTIIGGLLTYKSDWIESNIEENIKTTLEESIKNKNQELDFICSLSAYACALEYSHEKNSFYGENVFLLRDLKTVTDKSSGALLFSYFKLLRMLQEMGNAPAIEYSKYGIKGIDHES